MLYSNKIKKAMNLAYMKHHNQFDKAGYPYIAHVLHIAEHMSDEDTTIVALLHDILEDTQVKEKELEEWLYVNIIDTKSLKTSFSL